MVVYGVIEVWKASHVKDFGTIYINVLPFKFAFEGDGRGGGGV